MTDVVRKRKLIDCQRFDQPSEKKPRRLSGEDYSLSSVEGRGDETHFEDVSKQITADTLRRNYIYLKNELESQELIDYFHQSDIFGDSVLDEFKEARGRRRRNDLLIKNIYHTALNKDGNVIDLFTEALAMTDQQYILDYLKKTPFATEASPPRQFKETTSFVQVVQSNTVEPRDFIDTLVEGNALSFHEHEDVTRLDFRKDRVAFILNLANTSFEKRGTIIEALQKTYPKLFQDCDRKAIEQSTYKAVNIKMNLKARGKDQIKLKQELREIERKAVLNFDGERKENSVIVNDLVKDCRNVFEGLKISSVVIQLLTKTENSISNILRKIRSGKAADWLLSLIDETDRCRLINAGVFQLEVLVTENTDGNLGSLDLNQGCICQLNKHMIKKMKGSIDAMIPEIDKLLTKIRTHCASSSTYYLLDRIKSQADKFSALMECLVTKNVPRAWFCLIEEHIKTKASASVVQKLFGENMAANVKLNRNDVEKHREFLKNEIELRSFLPIIQRRDHKKYTDFLLKLDSCSRRSTRMAEFLKFLLSEEDLTWFWEQIRIKHRYIWETIVASKISTRQSEKDVLAIRLMNDEFVEEVDTFRLKKYLSDQTILELGFPDFEDIQYRKSASQFIVNRISSNNIGEVMIALRQGGYEHIYQRIKAGSLAKQYKCPGIYGPKPQRRKTIFQGEFDLSTALFKDTEVITASQSDNNTKSTEQSIGGKRRRACFTSTKVSEGGFISGTEHLTYSLANIYGFDINGMPWSKFSCLKEATKPATLQKHDILPIGETISSDPLLGKTKFSRVSEATKPSRVQKYDILPIGESGEIPNDVETGQLNEACLDTTQYSRRSLFIQTAKHGKKVITPSACHCDVSDDSVHDSESGFASGSEDISSEIANTDDFDDEGMSTCSEESIKHPRQALSTDAMPGKPIMTCLKEAAKAVWNLGKTLSTDAMLGKPMMTCWKETAKRTWNLDKTLSTDAMLGKPIMTCWKETAKPTWNLGKTLRTDAMLGKPITTCWKETAKPTWNLGKIPYDVGGGQLNVSLNRSTTNSLEGGLFIPDAKDRKDVITHSVHHSDPNDGSVHDSESGFTSGSEDFSIEIANNDNSDDERVSSCSEKSIKNSGEGAKISADAQKVHATYRRRKEAIKARKQTSIPTFFKQKCDEANSFDV